MGTNHLGTVPNRLGTVPKWLSETVRIDIPCSRGCPLGCGGGVRVLPARFVRVRLLRAEFGEERQRRICRVVVFLELERKLVGQLATANFLEREQLCGQERREQQASGAVDVPDRLARRR